MSQVLRSGPGRAGRIIVLTVAVVAGLLILGRILVNFYVEVLWQEEAGFLSTFWTRFLWSWGVRLLAGLLVGLALFLNLRLVVRTLSGIQIKRRFGNLEINEQLPRSYVFWGIFAVSALLGLWFGGSVTSGTGVDLLLAAQRLEWGIVDPVMGRDAGFYVLVLPLLRALVTFGLITAFLVFTVCVGGYAATGALRWGNRGVVMGHQPRVHLGAVLAFFILLLGVQFWLGRYELLQFGNSSVQDIFGYTDARARLPGLRVMTGIGFLGAALVFWATWSNRLVPLVSGVGVVLLGGLVVGQLYPALVQRFQVEPNELQRETPWIEHNIEFTRLGFGLADLQRNRFTYRRPVTGDGVDWDAAARQFSGLPLWTRNTLLTTFREVEARFPYYDFATVDLDRYPRADARGERQEPVALSVREVDASGIGDPNWQNLHIRERYITGMGAVAAAAADGTAEGRPPMYLSAIPPEFTSGAPPGLRLTRPGIYVGTRSQPYALITPSEATFLGEGGRPGEPGVDFPRGIPLRSLGRRLAFAWRWHDANLLFSREVTASSRFVFRRSVRERVEAVAPFFQYPETPYPVVHEGRVVWILEGFTTTRHFPLSSHRRLGLRSQPNYVRNSLKVTVDALTGEMHFYAVGRPDPLLQVFDRAFPDLLEPFEAMPAGLQEHVRYPQSLLDLQATVLLQYHQDTAPQFHGQQDVWERPNELRESTEEVPYRPEYGLYRFPGDARERFYLTTVFVPMGRQNLTGILAGTVEPDGSHRLVLHDVPVEDQVPGPRQIEAQIEQDPEISQQFSLWRTGGSQVWTGHLHLVPTGQHILYMEAVFLAAEADAIPQLRGIVVSDGERVVMAPTMEAVLAQLAGRDVADAWYPVDLTGGEGRPEGDTARWPREALELLDDAESQLRAGDWEGFGRSLSELRRLLERLEGGDGGPMGR